jgi:hypothetical protein
MCVSDYAGVGAVSLVGDASGIKPASIPLDIGKEDTLAALQNSSERSSPNRGVIPHQKGGRRFAADQKHSVQLKTSHAMLVDDEVAGHGAVWSKLPVSKGFIMPPEKPALI